MQASEMRLFHQPNDRLRLTVGEERSWMSVKPVWCAPLSRPGRYLALLDGKGEEIAVIEDPGSLPGESRSAVERELRARYLTGTVQSVNSARQEFGATYWHVETDRGPRDFVTQNLQENAQWLSDDHLLLVDVDGNRFEVPSVSALDARSRAFIHAIL